MNTLFQQMRNNRPKLKFAKTAFDYRRQLERIKEQAGKVSPGEERDCLAQKWYSVKRFFNKVAP